MSEQEDKAVQNLWHETHCHPGECICNLMCAGDLQPYRSLYRAGRVVGLREAIEKCRIVEDCMEEDLPSQDRLMRLHQQRVARFIADMIGGLIDQAAQGEG